MRVAGMDALLAAIIWVSLVIVWKSFDFGKRYNDTASKVSESTYVFVVQKHFELVEVVPSLRFLRMHVVEIIAGRRSERMKIEIRRQQQSSRYFLAIGYRVAFVWNVETNRLIE